VHHPISPKWQSVEKNGKYKKCSSWRNKFWKIGNFAFTCMGLSPSEYFSPFFAYKKSTESMMPVSLFLS
jgi:hypothetical protein